MTAKVRAKFVCASQLTQRGTSAVRYEFAAVYCHGAPENERFHRFTPSGTLTLMVDNPAIDGFYVVGREYYLDFTPVDAG